MKTRRDTPKQSTTFWPLTLNKKGLPAHPVELTYPCCLPTLGELGEMPPRGEPSSRLAHHLTKWHTHQLS